MLIISKNPSFKTKVEVSRKNDKGGVDTQVFTARFNRFTTTELKNLQESGQSATDVIKQKLIGWEGIRGADDNELEFNDENVDILLDIPEVHGALFDALVQSSANQQKTKN